MPLALSAISGAAASLGYMLMMTAIELVGVTITFPIVMGIEMIAGTTILYLVDPKQNPFLLFPALMAVTGAIVLDMLIQFQLELDNAAAEILALSSEASPLLTEKQGLTAADGLGMMPDRQRRSSLANAKVRLTRSVSLGKLDGITLSGGMDEDDADGWGRGGGGGEQEGGATTATATLATTSRTAPSRWTAAAPAPGRARALRCRASRPHPWPWQSLSRSLERWYGGVCAGEGGEAGGGRIHGGPGT